MHFHDRRDAGRRLARRLAEHRGAADTVVVALPRGGVAVGAEIAAALALPLDIVVPRKIADPRDPEYARGALAEDGAVVWGAEGLPSGTWVDRVIADERAESARRLATYRVGRPPRSFAGKTLIVTDDGVATGLTMEAALRTLAEHRPRRIILAVPHGARDSLDRLRRLVEQEVVLDVPEPYGSVGSFYDEFPQVTDDEVVALLRPRP